jgi:hypothetical protein
VGRGLVVVSGGAAWGCPLDWISEGDGVGCVRLHGDRHSGPRTGASAPHLRGFDENVPPVHSDSIRVAVVIGSEPEMHTVASRLDSMGADVSCSDGMGADVSCSDGMGADVSHLDSLGCGGRICAQAVQLA